MIRAHCTHLYEHELAIKVRYDEEVGVIFLLGARASCPRRRDEGGTPSLRGAYVTPGVNSYEDQQTKALQAGGALPEDSVFPARPGVPLTGWFFGKPLHTISRFRHQDAQPPPSPRVGEGGRGEEGANTPTLPLRPVWEKGGGGMLTEVDVLASPCVPSPVSGIRTPNLPLRPVWEKGGGGMRGQTRPTSPFAPCGRRGG